VHTNQFTIGVNFLGQKLVDWIHIPKTVFDKLPTIRYKDGSVCVHPKIELLRHYYVLSDFFSVAPDKDINKLLKRIFLLEKYILIPWLQQEKLWYIKDIRVKQKPFMQQRSELSHQLEKYIHATWFEPQKYVVKIEASALANEIEFLVHDTRFINVSSKLIACVKRYCKEQQVDENKVIVSAHEPFIGVIGPSYNGWMEVSVQLESMDTVILRLYSHATPVHVYDREKRLCSYFHSMSHWLWRMLFLDVSSVHSVSHPNQSDYKQHQLQSLSLQVAIAFKNIKYDNNAYTVLLKPDNFIGTTPIRNIYMTNNILRYKNINTVKILIDDKKDIPKFTYKYNEFEGKRIFQKKLSKMEKGAVIALPALHPSIPKTDKSDK
jgi:hypothetical protein